MKTRIKSMKLLAITLSLAALAAVGASWGASRAQTERQPSEQFMASGLVHVTRGQSVQLNVSWEPVLDDNTPIPGDDHPAAVKLMIFDADRALVAQSVELLMKGQSASLTLNRDLLARTEARLGLRAVAMVSGTVPGDNQRIRDDNVVASFEVADNQTRRTAFVSPLVMKGFNPQPEPPASQQ